jgi:tetratricopeptide (TPR) repeat protein
LLEYAKARIEWDEKERAGTVRPGVALPREPGTKWAEAIDYVSRGDSSTQQGDLNSAVALYTKAIGIDPRYADAYQRRGLIHRARGNHDHALADFTTAIEVDDESASSSYYSRGVTHMNRGDYDAAVADFTEAIKLDPYHAETYLARGVAHTRKENYDAAVADLNRAASPSPDELAAAREVPAPSDIGDHLDEVPVVLVVTADLDALATTDIDADRTSIVGGASVYPFVHNVLLAARDAGYGGVMTTVLCRQETAVRELLGIPEGEALASVVALGVPARPVTRLRRDPVGSFTTVDRWDGPRFEPVPTG